MKKGKRYVESAKLIDRSKQYETGEAIELALQTAKAKFDETLELHVRLGVDPRHADQQVRGVVVLPNGTGKTVRVSCHSQGQKKRTKRPRRERTSSARRKSYRRFRPKTGLISTSASQAPI